MRLSARWAPVLYFILGQAAWFACVMSAARGAAYLGILFALVLLVLHVVSVRGPAAEIKLMLTVVVLGGAWESALIAFGLLAYPSGSVMYGIAPLWLPALWALFAAQFNTTYRWLKTRLKTGVVLGALAGPLTFHAGAALGALRFAKPLPATVALACG